METFTDFSKKKWGIGKGGTEAIGVEDILTCMKSYKYVFALIGPPNVNKIYSQLSTSAQIQNHIFFEKSVKLSYTAITIHIRKIQKYYERRMWGYAILDVFFSTLISIMTFKILDSLVQYLCIVRYFVTDLCGRSDQQ